MSGLTHEKWTRTMLYVIMLYVIQYTATKTKVRNKHALNVKVCYKVTGSVAVEQNRCGKFCLFVKTKPGSWGVWKWFESCAATVTKISTQVLGQRSDNALQRHSQSEGMRKHCWEEGCLLLWNPRHGHMWRPNTLVRHLMLTFALLCHTFCT